MNEAEMAATALWADYVRAKNNLLKAGIIRSYKSTEGDFSEWLVELIFKGQLPDSKSHIGYDVLAGDKKIQVKSITKMFDNPNGYGVTRKDRQNNPERGATHYAFVFFEDLVPDAVYLVPEVFVRTFPKEQIKRPDFEDKYRVDYDLSGYAQAMSK
ncbi:hypothetical protein HY772_09960 [Candidatus Woesearchaeota archaeon]|nr:hypothetical protein [Candidatus Woesearchaeota archaeon]